MIVTLVATVAFTAGLKAVDPAPAAALITDGCTDTSCDTADDGAGVGGGEVTCDETGCPTDDMGNPLPGYVHAPDKPEPKPGCDETGCPISDDALGDGQKDSPFGDWRKDLAYKTQHCVLGLSPDCDGFCTMNGTTLAICQDNRDTLRDHEREDEEDEERRREREVWGYCKQHPGAAECQNVCNTTLQRLCGGDGRPARPRGKHPLVAGHRSRR